MTPITETLANIPLFHGRHQEADSQRCVMECVAFVAGEPHSDHPKCACEVVTALAIYANDSGGEAVVDALPARILRMAGSNLGRLVSEQRAYFLADYAVRTLMPAVLRDYAQRYPNAAAVTEEQLQALSAVSPIRDKTALHAARTAVANLNCDGLLADNLLVHSRLVAMLNILPYGHLYNIADKFTSLDQATSANCDLIALLDALLDIGDTQPVPVDEKVARRIKELAQVAEPA